LPVAGFQTIGLAGMLENQDLGAVVQLERAWALVNVDPNRFRVVIALRESFRNPDPGTVTELAKWSANVTGDVRNAAIRALTSIHTREALPFLATLLGSTDPQEQAQAVIGLSAFANACPMQTAANVVSMAYLHCPGSPIYTTPETKANYAFRIGTPEQEASLVSFWKQWWANHPELH
jgi:hypothetical protein